MDRDLKEHVPGRIVSYPSAIDPPQPKQEGVTKDFDASVTALVERLDSKAVPVVLSSGIRSGGMFTLR